MQFKINGTLTSLANEASSIDYIFEAINSAINDEHLIFTHLNIDGVDVYEDQTEYIANRIKNIETIDAILVTKDEFLNELLLSAETYLAGALPEVKGLSNGYYQGADEETWHKFYQMIEGIQWIVQMADTVNQYVEEDERYIKLVNNAVSLGEILQMLEGALKQADNVLIGDIIQYEIEPLMTNIKASLSTIIDDEVPRHDVN